MWKKCLECIDELLDILFDNNNNIFIGENIAEDSENLAISDQVSHLLLCLCFFVFFVDPSQLNICSCLCLFVMIFLYIIIHGCLHSFN